MHRLRVWLEGRKDLVGAIKDLVTIVALILGLISIAVAIYQLRITAASIKSNTVYQITHEGRDLAKTLTPHMPAERIGPVVNFIYAVWSQHRLGTYDDELWAPFLEEVCQFLKSQSNFADYWTNNHRLFSKKFALFMEERRKQCA